MLYGGIVGINTDDGLIKTVYSLENIYGVNNGTIEKSSIKTPDELKLLDTALGNAFKKDVNNINNGYPIFQWQ